MSSYIVRFNHKRKQIFKSQKMRQLFSWSRLTPYSGFWTPPLPLRLGPHQLSPPSLLSSISSPARNTLAHFPQHINIFKSISYFKNKNKTYLHLILPFFFSLHSQQHFWKGVFYMHCFHLINFLFYLLQSGFSVPPLH